MENNPSETTPQKSPCFKIKVEIGVSPFVYLLAGLSFFCSLGFWSSGPAWGYYSSIDIWEGAYWAYLTSCFVHGDFLHLYFNLYWLFILGRPFEREYGFAKSVLFFVYMAVVTSGLQFLLTEDTGVGLSGVIYGFFAFMWAVKSLHKSFDQLITSRLAGLFLTWLIACFVLSLVGVWDVGNIAHLTGLIFGWLAGRALVMKKQKRIFLVGTVCAAAGAITPLFWMPGSIDWINFKAYQADVREDYPAAEKWYSKSIEMDPTDAWPYYGRATVYEQLGRKEESLRDFEKVQQIDPEYYKEMVSDPNK
jgi:membrane associated rhomboid family serine protease